MARSLQFLATIATGFEPLLVTELRKLGLQRVTAHRGLVRFYGKLADGYTAVVNTRLASRVLLHLGRFQVRNDPELYAAVRQIDWTEHLTEITTLAIRFSGTSRQLRDERHSARRVKDAICDQLREEIGLRPDIDLRNPDLTLLAHLKDGAFSLAIDLGGPLFHRGGDRVAGRAPLRETLAAALLHLAGWPERAGTVPFLDPMCGSGTLVLEAAAMAARRAPGLTRGEWGSRGWLGHDKEVWSAVLDTAWQRAESAPEPAPLLGTDSDRKVVAKAQQHAHNLGLSRHAQFATLDVARMEPPPGGPGVLVTNAPYGERLGDEEAALEVHEVLGANLRAHFGGWDAWVFTKGKLLVRTLRLKPSAKHRIRNGPIDCLFVNVPVRPTEAGS